MPLVKGGRIVADDFIRIEDGAGLPATGKILVPAARFLADHGEYVGRGGAVGVSGRATKTSPNWRRISTRIALIALVFPAYKDGRAFCQARLLRSDTATAVNCGRRGRYCATSSCFCCVQASAFLFDVVKEADAVAFGGTAKHYSVFFQPTGDGRMTVARSRLSASAKPARASRVAVWR